MALRSKTREISIVDNEGTFKALLKKFSPSNAPEDTYDFEGIGALRKLLSNEKARILHVIKAKKPTSIYALSQMLERDVKAVKKDLKLLERFGVIDLASEKVKGRQRLKPILATDQLILTMKI